MKKDERSSKTQTTTFTNGSTGDEMTLWQERLNELELFKKNGQISYREYNKQKRKIEKEKPLPTSTKRTALIVIGAILIFLMVTGLFAGSGNESENNNGSSDAAVSKSDAERVCQEHINNNDLLNQAGFNKKYINLIDLWDYNPELYDNTVGNNELGNDIYLLKWNGVNTTNDSRINFSCFLSKDESGYLIHWMSANGVDLAGAPGFRAYSDDGTLIE